MATLVGLPGRYEWLPFICPQRGRGPSGEGLPSRRSALWHHSACRSTPSDAGPRPSVVPLVPSNKTNESSLHGAAFTTNRHYAYRHPVYTTKRAHEQDVCWLSPRLLTKLLTNRFDLDRSRRYSGGRSLRSAQLSNAGGSWLTRKRSVQPQVQRRPPTMARLYLPRPTTRPSSPRTWARL
jgi:hypothetical protein